jgi:hypothetical protein
MPVEGFEVIVAADEGITDKETAIADASRYLAYADQTDTFGYHGGILGVDVHGDEGGPFAIGFQFAAPIEDDHALKRFMDEMAQLSHVESVERISITE